MVYGPAAAVGYLESIMTASKGLLLGSALALCLAGCMPPDRSAQAEQIATQVAALPGVERAYSSYFPVWSSGRRLTVQITVAADVSAAQLNDAWQQAKDGIDKGRFRDHETYISLGRCLLSRANESCRVLCPPSVDTPNLDRLSAVEGCSYLVETGSAEPPDFTAWLETWQH